MPLLLRDRINALERSSLGGLSRRLRFRTRFCCCLIHPQFVLFCLSPFLLCPCYHSLLDTPGITVDVTIALRFYCRGRGWCSVSAAATAAANAATPNSDLAAIATAAAT